ncbi:DUF4350 domain-containing protein [Erythrobacter sp. THAF29]|uniref:DUF4350 domain-containing protein n=1 Tax=Erythrobacter sp. THAF29 TaxID=2587851 RepID=UPI00126848FB|nr:DUF4350 domain-containing protein [Erythrobacter sp. THAF29]QFT78909.1 hypothetical protein FIU90_15280 [Erythrobacter sp. THAF29]
MSIADQRSASPFSRFTVFVVVLVGFLAFIAMLYFLGAGDTGERQNRGEAHATATGLNGYAGLVRLLERENFDVTLSRTPSGLETNELLVLTPSLYSDPEEIGQILENRQYLGPTLVILPKWMASPPPQNLAGEAAGKFKDGWVQLTGALGLDWTESLPSPFSVDREIETLSDDEAPSWQGLELSGELPTKTIAYSEPSEIHDPIITDAAGHTLAFNVLGEEGSTYYSDAYWTIFVVEPDLVNNYGLADPERAKAAVALVREAGFGNENRVTFDQTLNGFGGAENLLTLAFRPPFLAATLCLILAMVIIGWRAFLRFGPAAIRGPEIAFGKKRLVSNGAGLIVRAKRLRLLAAPYAALSARRLAAKLGLHRHEPEDIDAALAARLPEEEPFSTRAERLRNAHTPNEILRAAQALRELEGKLAK